MTSATKRLTDEGVAIWLDDLSRERLHSGSLATLVADMNVVGVTTNPTIFHSAISSGSAYEAQIAELSQLRVSEADAVRLMTCADVRVACDVLRPVYDATEGQDGWVSIEVDPHLARNAPGTVSEARTLRWLVDRPNVMIKIPATLQALPAVTACLAEGISVNATLLFAVKRYDAVSTAFLEGMLQARQAGRDLRKISSVASFFISRVDAEIDSRLAAIGTESATALAGKAAIANARLAFHRYERMVSSPAWQTLAEAGARPQRLLWASTGVKDERYEDTRYVTELVSRGTVNTMPEATLTAVADHAIVRGDSIRDTYEEATEVVRLLTNHGISMTEVTTQLERDGLRRFRESWNALQSEVLRALRTSRAATPRLTAQVS